MQYLWAWGTLIHEKNLGSKISCQTPYKGIQFEQISCVLLIYFGHYCKND